MRQGSGTAEAGTSVSSAGLPPCRPAACSQPEAWLGHRGADTVLPHFHVV